MNRRLLVFFILVNAFVSLTISVTVVWVFEQRRPDPEELVAQPTAAPVVVLISTPMSADAQTDPGRGAPPATPTATEPPPEPGETTIYVVKAGDTLLAIAARFGLAVNELMEVNDLTDPDFVFTGQRLVIPVSQNPVGAPENSAAGLPRRGLQLRIENAGEFAAEAVQVVNDSDGAVDLQGWTLSRADGPIYTFGSALLFPGSGIRLFTGAGQDNSINRYWGRTAAAWETGSIVVLRNSNNEPIAQTTVADGQR